MDDDGASLDPLTSLQLVTDQRRRTDASLDADPRLLYGVWGVAWLVGFGLFWLSSPFRVAGPLLDIPLPVVGVVYAALLLAAAVVSIAHTARMARGLRGVSARTGAMYGWSWTLGFVALPCIVLTAGRLGANDEVLALLWPAVSGLVVGLLYLAGGAIWDDTTQYAIGAWLVVTTAVGALFGPTGLYLVMALAGGGGFLLAAAWSTWRRRPA